jgi:hypothetical protein
MGKLIDEGKKIKFVQTRLLNLFLSERVRALSDGYTQLVDIGMNYSSQLASLVNENMGSVWTTGLLSITVVRFLLVRFIML